MMRKSKVLLIVIFLFCIMAFPIGSKAGDRGGFSPGGYFAYGSAGQHATYRDFFVSYPNRFGRRYLRHYYSAYPSYPYEEKSPYQDLVIRPAGELQIMVKPSHAQVFVKPSHAQVFVDGYEVEKENDLFYAIGLLTGAHSVKVIAEGYKPHCEEVQIKRGKKKVLSVELTK